MQLNQGKLRIVFPIRHDDGVFEAPTNPLPRAIFSMARQLLLRGDLAVVVFPPDSIVDKASPVEAELVRRGSLLEEGVSLAALHPDPGPTVRVAPPSAVVLAPVSFAFRGRTAAGGSADRAGEIISK
ncbi:uncharacterized protein PpBr36_06070 [Pyricularia pennisetigena]|uniref:uncharacterized protein n=1 Tax=Pyricularia pennisetigena TaxID=1578925 RepID=UPI0011527854|nr:uncharacterized protein PpBr36_06070 [Pyricularia pennisetigena]TLS23040.1 hypothetical protein PpBr36_06070 [Pyricularia pennisetigena]